MNNIFIILFAVFTSLEIYADTFERVEIIGANADGSRIAVVRSYFGPSSYAPVVILQVLEAGKQIPNFDKGQSAFEGNESKIQEMREMLLKENSDVLLDFGIKNPLAIFPVDALASVFDNQLLVEADIYQSGSIARYSFFQAESNSTCEGQNRKPLAFQICSHYEDSPAECTSVEPYSANGLGCYSKAVTFSRMVRIGSFLWFHLFVRTEPLDGLNFYSQVIHAIKYPSSSN